MLSSHKNNFRVRYKGKILDLSVGDDCCCSSESGGGGMLVALKSCLEVETKIPSAQQKLIVKGKKIDTDKALFENVGEVIRLIGSTVSDIAKTVSANVHDVNQVRVLDDLSIDDDYSYDHTEGVVKHVVNPDYGFQDIQVLPQFSDSLKAKEILTRLASEPGVLACMKLHKWKVGVLSEMYPEGYVGVSDVCLLGVNKNKGMEISLRIRTDDLLGFRKYLAIKKVLYHELAHMVHSEHDSKFYELNSQIERECNQLDWRKSKGRVLVPGSNVAPRRVLPAKRAPAFSGGVGKLGKVSSSKTQEVQKPEPKIETKTKVKPKPKIAKPTKPEKEEKRVVKASKEEKITPPPPPVVLIPESMHNALQRFVQRNEIPEVKKTFEMISRLNKNLRKNDPVNKNKFSRIRLSNPKIASTLVENEALSVMLSFGWERKDDFLVHNKPTQHLLEQCNAALLHYKSMFGLA